MRKMNLFSISAWILFCHCLLLAQEDTPVPTRILLPKYPQLAIVAASEGMVKAKCFIDADGKPFNIMKIGDRLSLHFLPYVRITRSDCLN
jgi:hypothetical protein